MSEVITVQDLETLKKHEIFEAEVLTGKVGGLATGADIDYATNQATGQVQKTMPAILRDIGFTPAAFDFTSGGTLGVNDRDKAVLWPLPGGDGDWYYWEGALPKVIPPASSPAATGGVANGAWRPVGDITLREELAESNGAGLIGFAQTSPDAVVRTVQDELRDSGFSIKQDGAKGDGVTDDTAYCQSVFTHAETAVKTIRVLEGRYLIGNITLGDPATAGNRFPSNQGQGIYNLHGVDRERCTFVAKPGTTGTLIKRNNLSGVTFEKFGVDGQGIVDVGLDLSWIGGAPVAAPSVESVFRDIFVTSAKVTGIILDQMHDCTIDSIKSIGSPIAMSLRGGGGQLNLTNSNFSGIVNSSAQNLAISNSVFLKGFSIEGSADNIFSFSGCQIFPIDINAAVPSYKSGHSLDAQDAAGFGCNVSAISTDFFGTTNCIAGVFDSGGTFENCRFEWGAQPFFGLITGGRAGRKPKFIFKNCIFATANSPYGTNPFDYVWEMHNCVLHDGTIVNKAGNRIAGTWTPTFGGSTANGSTTYTTQSGSFRVEGNICFAYFDIAIDTTASMAGVLLIKGLPLTPVSGASLSGGSTLSLVQYVTLDSGFTALTAYTTAGQTDAVVTEYGSAKPVTPLPVANVVTGSRLSGCISYPIA